MLGTITPRNRSGDRMIGGRGLVTVVQYSRQKDWGWRGLANATRASLTVFTVKIEQLGDRE